MQQETGVWVERAAEMVELVLHGLDAFRAPHARAGNQVAVTVEVLRRAVQRQIEPACQWLETDGRSEGVVDERHQPMLARERRRGFEVRDLQERVCERLEVDRFRIAPHL